MSLFVAVVDVQAVEVQTIEVTDAQPETIAEQTDLVSTHTMDESSAQQFDNIQVKEVEQAVLNDKEAQKEAQKEADEDELRVQASVSREDDDDHLQAALADIKAAYLLANKGVDFSNTTFKRYYIGTYGIRGEMAQFRRHLIYVARL